MKVFKTKTFERWAGKAGVTDGALLNAVAQVERGELKELSHEKTDD